MIETIFTVVVMIVLMLLRFPVFYAMALAVVTFALVYAPIMQPEIVVQGFMQGLDNSAFTALVYFFVVGAVMNAGGMSDRLLDLARALLSHIRGGLSHANIASSMIFAGISGSAAADASAVGSVMIPAMKKDGYSPAYAAAVTATSATIGLVIPPSIPMVVFGLFTGADIARLFVAGILPGLAMGLFLLIASFFISWKRGYPAESWAGWSRVFVALRRSALALVLPVLVIGGMVGGVATVSEIGALAVVYAIFISLVVYRETTLPTFFKALIAAATDSAKVLIIVSVAGAFIWITARMGVANQFVDIISSSGWSPTVILAVTAVFLLLLGTVLDPIIIMIVVAPLVAPAAVLAGVDLTQLGIVVVLSSAIGLVTPPMGILLFITAAQSGAKVSEVVYEAGYFLIALVLLLAVVVAWSPLTLWLPDLLLSR